MPNINLTVHEMEWVSKALNNYADIMYTYSMPRPDIPVPIDSLRYIFDDKLEELYREHNDTNI